MPIIDLQYGTINNINEDVDLFRDFYLSNYREQAFSVMLNRVQRKSLLFCIPAFLAAIMSAVPMFINSESIFAIIILLLGCCFLGVCGFYLRRLITAKKYCEDNFDWLMDADFDASRSQTKRIFHMLFYEDEITVEFGATTSVKQKRSKRYEDIAAVVETNDLLFIQGLTWISRFQVDESLFETICNLLKEKCSAHYVSMKTPPLSNLLLESAEEM